MKSNELEQLKSEYYIEIEKFNRIKELLNTEQLIEFIKLTNENNIRHRYEYIDHLKIMKDVLTNFKGKITSSNDIYVCIGAYAGRNNDYDEHLLQEWPIMCESFIFRIYKNIEDKKIITCYKTNELKEFYKYGNKPSIYKYSDVSKMLASDFEKENIVLNQYSDNLKTSCDLDEKYHQIRTEFFLDCMTMSQEESKQRLLKKHNRM